MEETLEDMSAELALLTERYQQAAESTDIVTRQAQIVALHLMNVRRGENATVRKIMAEEQTKQIIEDLRRYISILEENQVRDWKEKAEILSLRYVCGLEWNDICQRIYGTQPDYYEKQASYRRRAFRRHEAALSEIWHLFESGRGKR